MRISTQENSAGKWKLEMAKQIKTGDNVEWQTAQGGTTGVVKKKLSTPTKIQGHKVAASKENPEFLVESGKTGKKTAHKASALKKTSAKNPLKAKKPDKQDLTEKPKKETSTSRKSSRTPGKEKAKTSDVKAKSATVKKEKKAEPAKRSGVKSRPVERSSKTRTTKKQEKSSKAESNDGIIQEFKAIVNLSPKQLERWLKTNDSKKVGFKDEGTGESVGHESGRKILKIMAKRRDRYTDEDIDHIRKVVGYIKRHLAQKPKGDISASNWRYSLMNWGHDPAK